MNDNLEKDDDSNSHWLTVSDLMSGVMIVFMFISFIFMRASLIEKEKALKLLEDSQRNEKRVLNIARAYEENKSIIYDALQQEFQSDLKKWKAKINKDSLSFDFTSPEVLFKTGNSNLSDEFKGILNDFFPRYISTLEKFKEKIQEVRIEGHTSSKWSGKRDDIGYFLNMDLSQSRAFEVLHFSYYITRKINHKEWIKTSFVAVGYSSSKRIFKDNGLEDYKASRRVTFKVLTNAEEEIKSILYGKNE